MSQHIFPTTDSVEWAPPLKADATLKPNVEVEKLHHWYGQDEGRREVLVNINVTLYPGEIVILTGPSGAGKTTLLTLVGAIRSVQEGSLKIMGTELKGLSQAALQKIRKNIGFIFQRHNLFESLTAFETLKLAMSLHSYPREVLKQRPREILTELGLQDRMSYKPAKLSEGQKQRVAIGRALINHPSLILADEPTASLDRDSARQVMNLLSERARQEHCTILIVTHDERIHEIAHRIIRLMDGTITSATAKASFCIQWVGS